MTAADGLDEGLVGGIASRLQERAEADDAVADVLAQARDVAGWLVRTGWLVDERDALPEGMVHYQFTVPVDQPLPSLHCINVMARAWLATSGDLTAPEKDRAIEYLVSMLQSEKRTHRVQVHNQGPPRPGP